MEEIKKNIIFYDKLRYIFDQLYPKINSVKYDDSNSDLIPSKIYINGSQFIYNILGRFDGSTNFWEWGWVNENTPNKIAATRGLLNYGIYLYDEEIKILRQILINSKIKVTDKINLDIILATSLMFVHSAGFKFIYPIKESSTITKYLILKPI
jgi:hypothetical protein